MNAIGETTTRVLSTARERLRDSIRGIPLAMGVLYVISSLANVLLWGHMDLNFTVGSSYGYLFGHILDFYDYNYPFWTNNDYFPTTYIVFAIWMAPVKAIVSPGVQNMLSLSPAELIWARILLLLLFWATFYVITLIAKELFPNKPRTQLTVKIAFLVSPFAAFAFNMHGQYDIIGVFFSTLGFLYYLRGDKWKFALYFGLAATCKYFALLIFVPLVLLQFKKFKHIILLGLVGIAPIAIEVLFYLSNTAFRERTLFRLLGEKVNGTETQTITQVVLILYVVGLFLLWRLKPISTEAFHIIAVHVPLLAFGFMFIAVSWHPYWFLIMVPYTALSIGFLRRPAFFIIWECIAFFAYAWVVANNFSKQIDVTMLNHGPLGAVMPLPRLILADIYSSRALPFMSILVLVYLLSPVIFIAFERALRVPEKQADPAVPMKSLWLRFLTILIVWTLPCLALLVVPISWAVNINPSASVANMKQYEVCPVQTSAAGPLADGAMATQTFISDSETITGISVAFGTYGHQNAGTAIVVIRDEMGTELTRGTADLGRLTRDDWLYFTFTPVKDALHKTFTAEITTSGTTPETGIALYGAAEECNPTATATWNGQAMIGDFHLSYYGKR